MDFIIILCAHLNINNKKKEINIETYINLKKSSNTPLLDCNIFPFFTQK